MMISEFDIHTWSVGLPAAGGRDGMKSEEDEDEGEGEGATGGAEHGSRKQEEGGDCRRQEWHL